MDQALLRVSEVAARLRVTPQTVRKLIQAGRLPAMRTGFRPSGHYRIEPADLEQYIAAQRIAQQVRTTMCAKQAQQVSPPE